MDCFKCSKKIVALPENDPARKSDHWFYTPAFVVEVVGRGPGCCRCAILCWACMHEILPDMWMSDEGWTSTQPALCFENLPLLDHDADNCWDIETYSNISVPPKNLENLGFLR